MNTPNLDATTNGIKRLLAEHESSQQRFRVITEERDMLKRNLSEAEVRKALADLLAMCEELNRNGHIPWETDTRAATEARYALNKTETVNTTNEP